ncbi:YegS/Rv2252/BmrU family lipid kinase [Aquibacillus halophilus]|uniref:YegS/Rv2252/BmrU family lipid kinase n=1 Tax=Aquibacillus halophilus TaxID=930132 RepID=A0A6A8DIP3_9BACI|nr:diacylglycerol kinase family protein [Aquibacillus halophilus]MRH42807.1 YegS/Rv2252/BmrU family lipid kinase [Aquibacillus halophilus]
MYIFIVNPIAGKGQGLKILNKLKKNILFKQIPSRCFITDYPGHAELLARQAVKMYPTQIKSLIVIGGDGTFYEVLNGTSSHRSVPLSFIPAGSGNDFARGYRIKGNPSKILKRIIEGNSTLCWPGSFTINERQSQPPKLFANSIGFGFDAQIVKTANQSKYKGWLNKWNLGTLTYVIALIDVLRKFKPKTIELVIDGQKRKLENVWMVTISNHSYYGGGMKIIPNTKIQPRVFPMLIIKNISHWKVLALFVTVFWGGHIRFKEVSIEYISSLQISSDSLIDYQVDGQYGTCYSCKIMKQSTTREINGTMSENNLLEITS